MIVMKFGGTSLGNAERIRQVARLIEKNSNCFVVVSAMSGVTNTLVDASDSWKCGDDRAVMLLEKLRDHFMQTSISLFDDAESLAIAQSSIHDRFNIIQSRIRRDYSIHEENWLLAQGEIITSELFALYMNSQEIAITWLNALDFMSTGSDDEPSISDITQRLQGIIGEAPVGRFLTQGYICLDQAGNTSNLKRGGSDYTATLAGAALMADSIEIWTDIDGVRNNDPRIVDNTFPIREMSFDEAAELAYFGAKILHPSCVWPASNNNITIKLKNTLDPVAAGTTIRSDIEKKGITAVAAKEGITVIRIRSDRMLNAYGFLSRIFAIFEKYKTPIDVITTSEISVSVTIDNPRHLAEIENELGSLGAVSAEAGQAIVCVVGDILEQHQDRAVRILDSLRHFNVKMISFGGSRNNISIVVPEEQRIEVLRSLNNFLFSNQTKINDPWLISQV
ncbi:MAG: aspartate kinase [Bacteroidales bacterium]